MSNADNSNRRQERSPQKNLPSPRVGTVVEKDPAGDNSVNVRVPLQRRAESLDDGHHAGARLGLLQGACHHLADGFAGESCEPREKLSMKKEIGPQHFRNRKHSLGVRDVGENLVLE